ncbi:efflux RND transporter periplasmic adaptor subunit [Virgibacillus sp. LDC-1]|uniref:efflux RND transporter periplasmic adaptor subunit n=1 Tax=Virgibacillus sp. LDC-1 TaxID=3039856 RepID=UPI0024DE0CBF|nr:efflux RND transporter periplasmic adaptor subunit [Virgibacillus sp. LDC-1]
MKKIYVGLVAILLIGLLSACTEDDATNEKKEDRIVPVETMKVTEGDFVIEKSIYGRTAPSRSTPIILSSPGEVDEWKVKEGEKVTEDDKLAVIQTPRGNQTIYAPTDGTIVDFAADEGMQVSGEEPIAMIVDLNPLKVSFSVTESMQKTLQQEEQYPIKLGKDTYDTKVTSIGTIPNDAGLFTVEATVDNKKETILPGTVVKMRVPIKRVQDTLIVPTRAVMEESGSSFIFKIVNGKAKKVTIEIEDVQSYQTAIKGEVKAGEDIVVNGQLTLSDNSKVDVVKESGE